MEILLVRHGRPSAAVYPRVNASGFVRWVRRYHHSGIASDSFPKAQRLSDYSDYYVVSSDLKRAMESTLIFLNQRPTETSKIYREMEIPRYKLPLVLTASHWLYLNRLLWTLGFKGPFESYSEAKYRAQEAAHQLVSLAETHNKVMLFSHGYLNFHIRRYLCKAGWQLTEKSSQHWGITRLQR
ncbi:histidine phosphatase family protein [Agarivorans sp. MS3-6]